MNFEIIANVVYWLYDILAFAKIYREFNQLSFTYLFRTSLVVLYINDIWKKESYYDHAYG